MLFLCSKYIVYMNCVNEVNLIRMVITVMDAIVLSLENPRSQQGLKWLCILDFILFLLFIYTIYPIITIVILDIIPSVLLIFFFFKVQMTWNVLFHFLLVTYEQLSVTIKIHWYFSSGFSSKKSSNLSWNWHVWVWKNM